jgi:trk system potassium uptake protein TrkA
VVVIGLERFDRSLAGRLTHVVEADSTDEEALRQLSVPEFERVVIGIGTNLEASILTASAVLDLEVKGVWAKAITYAHARILSQFGVHHVVRPEHDMGKRVAHLVRGRMLDYIEFDDGFALAKTTPPTDIVGRPLGETHIRSRFGVTVVAVKRMGEGFTYATAETVVSEGELIIVSGRIRDVERFSELA